MAIKPETVVAWLGRTAAFLVVAFVATQYVCLELGHVYVFGLVPLFDLAGDGNLPSFFLALLLIACGLALVGVAYDQASSDARLARRWSALGGLLLFLGIDEAAQLQGRLALIVSELFQTARPFHSVLTMAGCVAAAAWLAPLMIALPRATLRGLALASTAAFGGLIADEIGAAAGEALGYTSFPYALTVAASRGLELAAAILLLRAALEQLRQRRTTFRLFAA